MFLPKVKQMNKLFDAFAHFNKFLDVIGSIAVGIAMLAVTIAVFKPVFNGIGDSSVEMASLVAERGSAAVASLFAIDANQVALAERPEKPISE
jgi:hypothetical protein